MKRFSKHIIVIVTATCLLLASMKLAAQHKIQVASKSYSYDYDASATLIKLYAEKSEIVLNPSADDICRVEIKLISKNSDQQEAIRDLKAVKYSVEEKSGIVNLKNYFDPPEVRPVKSNLSVRYTIYVPVSKRIEINCLYSQITAQSVNINCSIDAAFSDVTLNKCNGRILLKTYYSGLLIDRGGASLSGSLDKSDMTMVNFSGPVDLKTHYGIINIRQEQMNANWKLIGSYTEFSLAINKSLLQNCKLTTFSGSIDATAQYQKMVVKEKNKTTLPFVNDPSFPAINISTTFNSIHLYEPKE